MTPEYQAQLNAIEEARKLFEQNVENNEKFLYRKKELEDDYFN